MAGQSEPEKRGWIQKSRRRRVLFGRAAAAGVSKRSSKWKTHNATSVWTIWKDVLLNPRFTSSPFFTTRLSWSHFSLCGPLPKGVEFILKPTDLRFVNKTGFMDSKMIWRHQARLVLFHSLHSSKMQWGQINLLYSNLFEPYSFLNPLLATWICFIFPIV